MTVVDRQFPRVDVVSFDRNSIEPTTIDITINTTLYSDTENDVDVLVTLTTDFVGSDSTNQSDVQTISITPSGEYPQTLNSNISVLDVPTTSGAVITISVNDGLAEVDVYSFRVGTTYNTIDILPNGKGISILGEPCTEEGFWIDGIRYDLTEEQYQELATMLGISEE